MVVVVCSMISVVAHPHILSPILSSYVHTQVLLLHTLTSCHPFSPHMFIHKYYYCTPSHPVTHSLLICSYTSTTIAHPHILSPTLSSCVHTQVLLSHTLTYTVQGCSYKCNVTIYTKTLHLNQQIQTVSNKSTHSHACYVCNKSSN